jgi:hypothetical protein
MATGETRYDAGDVLAVPAVAKGGRQISVEFTIILLQDSEQRISGVAAILRDVTARFEELLNWRVVAPTRMPLDDRDDPVPPPDGGGPFKGSLPQLHGRAPPV